MKYSGMNDKTEVYKDEPTSCRKCITFPNSKSLLHPLNKWMPILFSKKGRIDQ